MIGLLFVDDDDDVREVMVDMLSFLGFDEVTAVASAAEAFTAFDPERHHILITDYELPDLNGLIVAKEIKKRAPFQIPVAILSGAPPEVDPSVAVVFCKPLDLKLFETWLDGSRADAEIHYRPR